MNERIHILRQAIVVVTQALTGSDIEVTQQGLEAAVELDKKTGRPIRINLPYLPDNSPDSLIDAIQGFLDQEVAKYLFTDYKVNQNGNQEVKTLTSMLEDARVERMMAEKYQGSGINMRNAGQFFIDELIDDQYKQLVSKKAPSAEIQKTLMLPMMRALSGQQVFEHYLKDKMEHIQDMWDMFEPFRSEIEKLSSTQDVVNLSKRIYKVLEDEEPPMPDGDGDDGEAPSGKSPFSGAASGGSDGSEGEGENEGDGDEAGSGAGASEGENGEGDGSESKVEVPPSEVKHSLEDGEPSKGGKNAAAILDALKDTKNNYSEGMTKKIAEHASKDVKKAKYSVFSNDGDVIEPLQVPKKEYKDEMFKKLEDKVSSMVGPMQKDLERAIVARSKSVWENGLRKGKLNNSSLARLASTKDDRVFRKRHDSTTKNVAVSLVVDMSGSMSGSKIHTAAAASYALSSVLERLKIPHEVICFTTHTTSKQHYARMEKIREAQSKYSIRYSRVENLYMPIIKGYDERINTETKRRFGFLPHSGMMANNIDGECVEIAARRLASRKEAGKIMMVLSDGSPAGHGDYAALEWHLKDVVQSIEKSKINIIGIGIQDSSVKRFYDKHIVINEVEELPGLVISRLRSMLLTN